MFFFCATNLHKKNGSFYEIKQDNVKLYYSVSLKRKRNRPS